MPPPPFLTWWDLVVYVWTSYFIMAIALGFPPIALVWLYFPLWHRRRIRRRRVLYDAARRAAQDAHTVKTFR